MVIIEGGLVSCEAALWLASQGKRVTIVEALPEIATGKMFCANRVMLLDLLIEKEVGIMKEECTS